MAVALTYLSDPEGLRARRYVLDVLVDPAVDPSQAVNELHRLIDVIDTTDSDQPQSVGLDWIRRRWNDFTRLVNSEDRREFFLQHIDNPHITDVLNQDGFGWLLDGYDDATKFVVEVAKHHVMPELHWLTWAVQHGVPTEVLARLVLDRIRCIGFTAEQTEPFVEAYLLHGCDVVWDEGWHEWRRTDEQGAWYATGDQLWNTLAYCTQRRPDLFFVDQPEDGAMPDKLAAYGREFRPNMLLSMAAGQLQTTAGLSVRHLFRLSDGELYRLARRALPDSLEFLVAYVCSRRYLRLAAANENFPPIDFDESWRTAAPKKREDLAKFFQDHFQDLQSAATNRDLYGPSASATAAVLTTLVAGLAEAGYVVAPVVAERRMSRGKSVLRFGVELPPDADGKIVKYRHQDAAPHKPHDGQYVIIDTQSPVNWTICNDPRRNLEVIVTHMKPADGSKLD